jgi:hypothetical protein
MSMPIGSYSDSDWRGDSFPFVRKIGAKAFPELRNHPEGFASNQRAPTLRPKSCTGSQHSTQRVYASATMEQNPGRRPEKHATQKKRPSFPTVRLLCPKSPDLFEQSSGPAIAASTPFASQPGDRGRERSAGKGSRGIHSAPLASLSGGASWRFSHSIIAMMDMARRCATS